MSTFRAALPLALRTAALVLAVALGTGAHAEPLSLQATLTPTQQIRLDFQDGSGHFLLMVRREGKAAGTGLFDGARVTEYGRHDIVPGVSGDPSGYLVLDKEDSTAYLKWTVRSIYLPGTDGKPLMNDNGFWEVVSGTGVFKGLKGAGTLHIKSTGPTGRLFVLDGTLAQVR